MSLFFGASATFLYITYFLLNFVNHIDLKRIKIQQNYRVHISHWSVISKSALRGRSINNFIELWCLAGSGGLDIWVSSTNFQKSNIGWPQQPPTERVSNISEKLDFWQSIPKKGSGIGHLGARNVPTIRVSKNFDEMRLSRSLRPLRLLRLLRSLRPLRF